MNLNVINADIVDITFAIVDEKTKAWKLSFDEGFD
jgi:hypothetical protein